MAIIVCQPVTNKTISTIRKRYGSLGWGEIRLVGSGNNVTGLHFKWNEDAPPKFPEVTDLGLARPHRL